MQSRHAEISKQTIMSPDEVRFQLEMYDGNEDAFWWGYRGFCIKGVGWPPASVALSAVGVSTSKTMLGFGRGCGKSLMQGG